GAADEGLLARPALAPGHEPGPALSAAGELDAVRRELQQLAARNHFFESRPGLPVHPDRRRSRGRRNHRRLAAGEAEAHESSGELLDPVDTESNVVAEIVAGGGAAQQHEPGVAGAARVRIAPVAPIVGPLDQPLVQAAGLAPPHSLP